MTSTTIDLTPTWSDILPALVAIWDKGDKNIAMGELRKMAKLADRYNELTSKVEYLPKREEK